MDLSTPSQFDRIAEVDSHDRTLRGIHSHFTGVQPFGYGIQC
ncbi:hypothetical protein AYI69_g5531, partial [Smittium culicis]